jgi:subtilisin family serine protease
VNGVADDPQGRPPDAAFVIIRGTFSAEDQFAVTFEGHGTASLWVQPEGDLADPSAGGVLLHGATREATVTLPATSPAVISVGATLNRTEWVDRTGAVDHVDSLGSVKNPPLDSVAFFSSAGPTTDSRLKPDLVAPGGFVVAAMSRDADPKDNPLSIFSDTACDPVSDCAVVDATHAVSAGTSMAAPMVAGAVALLFEQDPTLTTEQLRTLLQAGARRPEGAIPYTLTLSYSAQSGAGVLDLEGIRDVKDVPSTTRKPPDPHASWLTLGATYAHPDPGFPVPAVLKLKDASGRAALADRDSLELDVDRGRVVGTPDFAAPGLVRFSVAAESDTGGDTLRVVARNHGSEIASAELPIAVDVNVVREGFFGHGGCTVTLSGRVNKASLPLFVAIALVFRRTRRRAARRVTSRTT